MDSWMNVPCPLCRAKAGLHCTSSNGEPRPLPHRVRIVAVHNSVVPSVDTPGHMADAFRYTMAAMLKPHPDSNALSEPEWLLLRPGVLSLSGTDITIQLKPGVLFFHLHWGELCYGASPSLSHAKQAAIEVVRNLLLMGYDP